MHFASSEASEQSLTESHLDDNGTQYAPSREVPLAHWNWPAQKEEKYFLKKFNNNKRTLYHNLDHNLFDFFGAR